MRIPKGMYAKKVREKCLDCCAHQHKEIELCPAKDCPLWLLRFGNQSVAKIPELKAHLATLPKFDAAKAFGQPKTSDTPKRRGRPPRAPVEVEDPIEAALRSSSFQTK
jgi:hypothetical protein